MCARDQVLLMKISCEWLNLFCRQPLLELPGGFGRQYKQTNERNFCQPVQEEERGPDLAGLTEVAVALMRDESRLENNTLDSTGDTKTKSESSPAVFWDTRSRLSAALK